MKNMQKYRRLKNLFLRQSYLDAWEDYMRSIRKTSYTQWDYVVLTASNEAQAEAFECQIRYRQERGVLPKNTKFLVISDPDGKRIGSGGATLQVLRVLSEQEGFGGNFHGKRVLVIHSGGDSKRVPQYSVCGKLFSPVPRELPDGRPSTLFDEFLIGMAGVPSRFKAGVQDIWENGEHTLWTAKIYPSALKKRDAQKASMVLLRIMDGTATEEEILNWKNQRRYSLQESFMLGDTTRFIEWSTELQNQIMVEKFLKHLFAGEHYIPALKIFGESELNERQFDILMEKVEHMTFSEKIRVLYAVSRSMKYQSAVFHEIAYDKVEKMCFDAIQKAVCLEENCHEGDSYHIQRDKVRVTLPVRVNWGGGWTDTPPYCNEKGGVVLNAAILLKGERQIEVEVRKLEELHIEFASLDFQAYGTALSAEEIQDCNNPYDSFALHKAALIACGIIPQHGSVNLQDILRRLGGGIYISTRVCNVPKGSGLGTSSILAGAAVKAIGEFLGEDWSDSVLYQRVLNLEQIMSTGGGWQDQVGGLTPGVKYITTKPGMKQEIKVEHIELDEATKAELQERFALIYTGQRRLARNLLRYVVGGYIGGRPESIEALEEMKHLAVLMRYELEQGRIDEFAKLLNRHWEVSKKLDAGSTNTCIDQIFESCEDLIDGKFISGAGGGGFLQVILKKGVTKEHLRRRLRNVFQDSGVDMWESEFLW